MSQRSIMAEYERIRGEERRAQRQRAQEAYARDPRLAAIEEERRAAMRALGERLRRGGDFAAARAALEQAVAQLDAEQAGRLAALGYPADHLALRYRCPACKDTGFVGEAPRVPCACLVRRRLRDACASGGVREEESFEAFSLAVFPEGAQRRQMEQARRVCEAYANAFPGRPEREVLLLLGNTGLGKSYLVNCIANRALARGETQVKKATAFQLIREILAGIRAGYDAAGGYIAPKLLLVDDLGAEPQMQNITREYLFNILNERQEAGRATVIASNLNARELQARYGDRIFSRLFDASRSRALLLKGESLRLAQR